MMFAKHLKLANAKLIKQIRGAKAETEEVRRELKVAKDVEVWLDGKVGELEARAKREAESMRGVLEQHEKDVTVIAHLDRRATSLQKQCEAAAETILEANQRAEASVADASNAATRLAAADARAASLERRLNETEEALSKERARVMKAEGRAEAAESAAAKANAAAPASAVSAAPGNPFATEPSAKAAPATPGNPFSPASSSSSNGLEGAEVARLRAELAAAETRAAEAQEAAAGWNRKFLALAAHMRKLKGGR